MCHGWIPVRFDDCEIPDLELDPRRTLNSLYRADLFRDREDDQTERLIWQVRHILGSADRVRVDLGLAVAAGRQDDGLAGRQEPAASLIQEPGSAAISGAPSSLTELNASNGSFVRPIRGYFAGPAEIAVSGNTI